jgi:hypothetical protein
LSGERAVVLLGGRVQAVNSTGASEALATLPSAYGAFQLAASPNLLAVQDEGFACPGGTCKYSLYELALNQLLVASVGAPLACLSGGAGAQGCQLHDLCPPGIESPEAPLQPEAFVSGSTIAYRSCPSPGTPGQTELIEAPGGATSERTVTSVARPLALAGNWLVGYGSAPNAVLVELNLATQAEPVKVNLPPETVGKLESAAVQSDGALVYTLSGNPGPSSLWTASPAAPTPVRVPGPPLRAGSITLATGRSMSLASGHAARLGEGKLIIEDLGGNTLSSLSDSSLDGFGFDGTRVVATTTPCAQTFLESWVITETPPVRPQGSCPAPRIRRPVHFARRSIRVETVCPASTPLGCPLSRIEVRAARMRGPTGTFWVFEFPSHYADMLPGERHTFTVRFGKRFARWLARHRQQRITIESGVEAAPDGSRVEPDRAIAVRAP